MFLPGSDQITFPNFTGIEKTFCYYCYIVLSLHPKLLTMKLHILKIKDRDDIWSNSMYYTIKGLRETIINVWYDTWDENREEPQDYTKEQIKESDNDMFSWLNSWGYDVEVILTITEKDLV